MSLSEESSLQHTPGKRLKTDPDDFDAIFVAKHPKDDDIVGFFAAASSVRRTSGRRISRCSWPLGNKSNRQSLTVKALHMPPHIHDSRCRRQIGF
jgi:hypothetical protein